MYYCVRKNEITYVEDLKYKDRKWHQPQKGLSALYIIGWIGQLFVQFFLAAAGKCKQWEVQAIYLCLNLQIPYKYTYIKYH